MSVLYIQWRDLLERYRRGSVTLLSFPTSLRSVGVSNALGADRSDYKGEDVPSGFRFTPFSRYTIVIV